MLDETAKGSNGAEPEGDFRQVYAIRESGRLAARINDLTDEDRARLVTLVDILSLPADLTDQKPGEGMTIGEALMTFWFRSLPPKLQSILADTLKLK